MPVPEVAQRPIGIFERVGLRFDMQGHTGRYRQEFGNVAMGHVGNGLYFLLLPEMLFVADIGQQMRVNALLANCIDDKPPTRAQALQRRDHRFPYRRRIDDGMRKLRRIGFRVPGPVRAEFEGKSLLALAAGKNENRAARMQVFRELQHEMPGPAESRECEDVTVVDSGQTQRPVPDTTGAQKRCRLGIGEGIRDRVGVVLGHGHEFSIAAVDIAPGGAKSRREILRITAVRGVNPAHADPVANRVLPAAVTESGDTADDFVPGHDGQHRGRRAPFDFVQFCVAYTADRDLDKQLPGGRGRLWKIRGYKRLADLVEAADRLQNHGPQSTAPLPPCSDSIWCAGIQLSISVMDRQDVSAAVHTTAFDTGALEPEQLNSERIRQRFGSYGIEVLSQGPLLRRSNLFSSDNGSRTCRTYAVVRFAEEPGAAFAPAHEKVLAGRSIGATFREFGWLVNKRTMFIGTISVARAGADVAPLMQLDTSRDLGMHVYELLLEHDEQAVHYATIVELHHTIPNIFPKTSYACSTEGPVPRAPIPVVPGNLSLFCNRTKLGLTQEHAGQFAMKHNNEILALICGLLLFSSGPAIAQSSADDEASVIVTIEKQWQAEQDGEDDWIDESLTDDFSGWPKDSPAPRNRESVKMWDRFYETQGRMVAHELFFQNVVIHGDVAIAHYLYTSAFQDKDKETEVSNGRYTDVLVRTEEGWKFLAWHGGDDD